jgi:NADH-quinone oxidoreductase E subunit
MATKRDAKGAMTDVLERYPACRESLLEILHVLQAEAPEHYLSREALQAVADYLEMPPSEVWDAASFYSMYGLAPRGRHILRVCVSPPCRLFGGDPILAALKRLLKVDVGETTADGAFTLETSSCLGACDVAPAMMIDDELYGNLTEAKLKDAIARVRRKDGSR